MTLTEEQREAIHAVSGLLTAVGCPQCHYYIRKNYTHHIEVLRAMVDSSDHIVEPDELIGFDLEKVREAVHTLENFAFASGKITAGQIQDVLWGARLLAASAAEIERLRGYEIAARDLSADLTKVAGDRDDQAARIKELEDAHKRSGVKYAKIINELRSSVYANIPGLDVGKIGPDDSKKISHLRPYEVVAADLAGMLAQSWQITEERKAAIDRGLQFLEWSYAKNSALDTKEQITVLWAMLEEAVQE